MKSINELRTLVEQELLSLNYPEKPKELYKPIDYILSLGGKRMRPVLLLLAHQLFSDEVDKAIKPALAIEVFHNFTLLHDDIMDKAPLRRSKATVHEKWNTNVAILSGDAMLIQSYQYLSTVGEPQLKKVLDIFSKTALEVCEGQQFDMDFEIQAEVDIDSYLMMIEYKTAVLLAAALQIGALIGGASDEEANELYQFGKNIGLAFQLKDDLLDVFGDQKTFGKQVGGDIISNKKTYLYLKALSMAEGQDKMDLVNLYNDDDINPTEKVKKVSSIYISLNIPEHTRQLMDSYCNAAMKHLKNVSGNKKELEAFANLLQERVS